MMDFTSFARSCGVDIPRLQQDAVKIFRCPTVAHPKSTNGAYFFDGQRGWVMDWASGEPVQWWNSDKVTAWTDAEKREWHARRQAADQAKSKAHAEASARSAALIAQATRAEHAYLVEKGLGDVLGLVGPESELLVPMRDCARNDLLGVQVIRLVDNEWEKKMIYGMRAKGAVFRLGPRRSVETCFVEGYATGLSVDIALRLLRLSASVMVCFSAQNLVHVSQSVGGRRYAFADNDKSETGEKAAQQAGLPYCMADEVGMDANDLHQRSGVMAVAKKLMEVRQRL